MSSTIQLRRGLKANLPSSAAAGEVLLTTDTFEAYMGTGASKSALKVDWSNILNNPGDTESIAINAQSGTSYTVVAGDQGKLITHTNAAAIAVTLPQATGAFAAGWYAFVANKGVGAVTITPTTSTIDGAATLVLPTHGHVLIVSDGTNYQVFGGLLQAPSTTALGGVNSKAAVASNWLTGIGTDGSVTASQPGFTDISGSLAGTQLPATIDGGTF